MPRSFHFSAGIYRVSRSRSGNFWQVGSGSGLTNRQPGRHHQIEPAPGPAADPVGGLLWFVDEWRCVPLPGPCNQRKGVPIGSKVFINQLLQIP
jgi:hypothetical protein